MDGTHFKFSIESIRRSIYDDDLLREQIIVEIWRLALRMRDPIPDPITGKRQAPPFIALFPLLEGTLQEIRKQTARFSFEYPPSHTNSLSVSVSVPIQMMKVGNSVFEQSVVV